jgi:outer membrane biosynthesis protein TonB
LIERRHPAEEPVATLVRVGRTCALSFVLVAGLAGCRHKTLLVLPQVSMVPVDLETAPEPDNPPMIAAVPESVPVPEPSQPVEPPKKVTRRKPAPVKEAPPVQVASAAVPAELAIGALSSGGDSTPQTQQEAKELIAATQKRLKALSGKTASQQKDQVRQVRHFLTQAQQALDSRDAEGAKNLATKAKLLMDDVEKK